MASVHVKADNSSALQHRQFPGAHWPTRLTKTVNSRFGERPHLFSGVEAIEEDAQISNSDFSYSSVNGISFYSLKRWASQ